MRTDRQTISLRPNETLSYWRNHDLGDATLVKARYGPFRWEKHVHDEQVIVISEQGIGQVETRRGTEVGGPGTIWAFMPGEYHCGQVEDGCEWHYRALYLDQSTLEKISPQIGAEAGRLLVKPGLHWDPDLARLLLRTHALDHADRAEEQVCWSDALVYLFERYGDPRPCFERRGIGQVGLYLARDYIAEHFRDEISVDELARLANVSRYHFIRAFRSAFGLPPHAYINQVRLQYARKLLLAGRTAIEAALESGFYDQSRLNGLFKRAYGVTPARYANLASI